MNTQTHVLMGGVLFGGHDRRRIAVGMLGGLAPDIPQILIFASLRMLGVEDERIFRTLYFSDWWEIANAVGHSFLLWGGLLALALLADRRRASAGMSSLSVFAAAGLTHCLVDFLVHREDAHMQFWPLSRWKFVSPVSYYDPAHYGLYFAWFEAALGLSMAVLLMLRVRNLWACLGLATIALPYAAVPAYFLLFR